MDTTGHFMKPTLYETSYLIMHFVVAFTVHLLSVICHKSSGNDYCLCSVYRSHGMVIVCVLSLEFILWLLSVFCL